jgi:hypothetical protein
MDDSNIVEIYKAANSMDANIKANALIAAGINARVVGGASEVGSYVFPIGQPIGPSIVVFKEDEVLARALLEEGEFAADNAAETENSLEADAEEFITDKTKRCRMKLPFLNLLPAAVVLSVRYWHS